MTFLSIPADEINDVQEPSVVRTEEECQIAITDVTTGTNKNDEPYALVRFAFVEQEDAKTFTKYYSIPFDGLTKEKYNNALRAWKKLYEAFEIDYANGVELDQMIHAEGWGVVGVDEQEDTDYGPQNYVKYFVRPGQ